MTNHPNDPDRASRLRVTVCELSDQSEPFARDWDLLVAHAREHASDLVLLPEMPFFPWFGATSAFDERVWRAAVRAHDEWLERLVELAPAVVLGTRPVDRDGRRVNEGFRWGRETGYVRAHDKHYLPDEAGFYEASWYGRGDGVFAPIECRGASVGFEICTEIWMLDQARLYGKQGVHVIATPRATPHASLDAWIVGGRATAITSGAYALSSNHVNSPEDAIHFGGRGWVVAPDGSVLALTSRESPFATVEIDLAVAERAKHTYPRNVV